MPRELKPVPVGEPFRHRGYILQLFLDRNNKEFFYEVPVEESMKRFYGKDADTAKLAVCRHIDLNFSLDWEPVIEIDYKKIDDREVSFEYRHAQVAFGFHRFYYAHRHDGKLMKSDWDLPQMPIFRSDVDKPKLSIEEERMRWCSEWYWNERRDKFVPPCNNGERHTTVGNQTPVRPYYTDPTAYYLPYTDELWNGLIVLKKAIIGIREKLDDILTTPEGLLMIGEVGQMMSNLLPAVVPDANDGWGLQSKNAIEE